MVNNTLNPIVAMEDKQKKKFNLSLSCSTVSVVVIMGRMLFFNHKKTTIHRNEARMSC